MVTSPEPVTVIAPPLRRPHLMRQSWLDVTFLHWAVEPAAVARFMPPGVAPDVIDGRTYVGLVPFRMVGAGLARGPAVPWAGTFLETNVRLYSVDADGRRGVVFLSLDAERAVVVAGARAVFGLPYRWARMRFAADGDTRTYTARTRWPGVSATSRVAVRVGGPLPTARSSASSPPAGACTSPAAAGPPTCATRTRRGRCAPPRSSSLDDGLVAAAGLGDLAARPPDHVAFSEGVAARFGVPGRSGPAG